MTDLGADPGLIGRDEELAAMAEALDRARRGAGQVLTVSADAGVGKTRLARELALRGRVDELAVLWGGCSETELALPLLPFNEAIGNYLAQADVDKIRAELGPLVEPLGALVPQLGGPGRVGAAQEPMDPAAARLRLFEAVVALLANLSASNGLLLVVDDAHWADASTCELLDFLARRLGQLPVLLVVVFRRDEVGRDHPLNVVLRGWRRAGRGADIELRPFDVGQVSQKLAAVFHVDQVSDGFIQLVWSRSEGNPFVLEELLHDGIARGDIYREGDRWQRKPLAELRLPATVAESILSRLDRLDAATADVIQASAVLGRTFNLGTLAAVCQLPRDDVSAALVAAARHSLVEEDLDHVDQFHFRHALTHEAIASELTPAERRALHSRAADVLAQEPSAPSVDLARHLLEAGRTADAAPYCVEAAERAERAGAFAEAAGLYERALRGIDDPGERGRLSCRLGQALTASGQPLAGERHLVEGVQLLEDAGRVDETALPLLSLGGARWFLSHRQGVIEVYERAREILEARDATPELALLYARMAAWHNSELQCDKGRQLADEAIELAGKLGVEQPRAAGLIYRGWALCEAGHRDEGLATIDEGTQLAMQLLLPEDIGTGLAISAWHRGFAMRAGELTEISAFLSTLDMGPAAELFGHLVDAIAARWVGSVKDLERPALAVIEGAGAVGMDLIGWFGRELLAIARVEQRRLDEAAILLSDISEREAQWQREWVPTRIWLHMATGDVDGCVAEARRLLAMGPWAERDPYVASTVCHALVLAGAIDEAQRVADAALSLERHPFALSAAAAVAIAMGDTETATAHANAALEVLTNSGYRITEGHTRLTLVEAGDPDAQIHLERAALLARETGSANLADRVRRAGGEPELAPPPSSAPQPVPDSHGLSPRERELLALLAQGRTDAEIAKLLFISVATVRSHLDRVRDKTGRRRRPELTLLATQLGLV